MALSRLDISNIRNLRSVRLEPDARFNGLYGLNGSGKTSVLEAIYILGRGTSFRTKDLGRVLQTGASRCVVSGRLAPRERAIGVEYGPLGSQFRIAGESVRSRLELASQLPLLFISPESHALIAEGPQQRRRFLDWGVFHVEQKFLPAWRRYHRALKQRNKALGTPGVDTAWDPELVQAAEEITALRQGYLQRLEGHVQDCLQRLMNVSGPHLQFSPGWRQDTDYLSVLKAGLQQDRASGFTRHGPHRADVLVKMGNRPAKDTVSRGQQKLLVIAMLLAQVALLNQEVGLSPVILVDDVAAELDQRHRQQFLAVLQALQAQVFLTVTERQLVPEGDFAIRWFHVEQGGATAV